MAGKIRTTHVGSLPRPQGFSEADRANLDVLAREVDNIVERQVAIGIDIINDGEMSKDSYATYVSHRLSGFCGKTFDGHTAQDLKEYPKLAQRLVKIGAVVPKANGKTCNGPVAMQDMTETEVDIAHLRKACGRHRPYSAFLSAASPGVIAVFQDNKYYKTEEEYIEAVAEAMRHEYEAIVEAGFLLQLDCPDLAMNRHLGKAQLSDDEFIEHMGNNIAALNHACRNIPSEKIRMHICWGNYIGPHHKDIPLQKIIHEVLKAKPSGLLMEAANPRHAHEWQVFTEVDIPEDKILIPGVIDTCHNYVEHPELIAQRITQFANIVGPDRVIAGTDCGFATFADFPTVDPDVAFAKLKALVDGAALATKSLY